MGNDVPAIPACSLGVVLERITPNAPNLEARKVFLGNSIYLPGVELKKSTALKSQALYLTCLGILYKDTYKQPPSGHAPARWLQPTQG